MNNNRYIEIPCVDGTNQENSTIYSLSSLDVLLFYSRKLTQKVEEDDDWDSDVCYTSVSRKANLNHNFYPIIIY